MTILPILLYLTYTFLFKRLEEWYSFKLRVKGLIQTHGISRHWKGCIVDNLLQRVIRLDRWADANTCLDPIELLDVSTQTCRRRSGADVRGTRFGHAPVTPATRVTLLSVIQPKRTDWSRNIDVTCTLVSCCRLC